MSLFIAFSPPPSLAGCFPGNPSTGACDSGLDCGTGTWCCDSLSECSLPIPGNQQFTCRWDGTSCTVGAQNCDSSTGYSPVPSVCSSVTSSAVCNSTVSGCQASLVGPSADIWCDSSKTQIKTALGCLNVTGKETVNQILRWAVGIGGGIAFLLIVYSGIQMVMASGDPKRIKASQELLTAALSGLALIALSVVLLNLIGVTVLSLQGLGFNQ